MAMRPEQILHHAFLHLMEKNKVSPQATLNAALSVAANIGIDMLGNDEEVLVNQFRVWISRTRAKQNTTDDLH